MNDLIKEFRNSTDSEGFKVAATSFLPYLLLLTLAGHLMKYSYWWVLLLALPTHWFHARIFIIMHDCGHHSLFKSKRLNDFFGLLSGLCYLIPFFMWRELHNKHHQNQGRLEKRGHSLDVWTLTRNEWNSAGVLQRLLYRFYRNPLVLFIAAPIILFGAIFRIPFERFSMKAVVNIFALDLVIAGFIYIAPSTALNLFIVAAPSLLLSYFMASFLFYVQHQYENTQWLPEGQFDNEVISLKGSSYLKLNKFFEWCYGNINYHHVHHLDTKIPMYRLSSAHQKLNTVQTLPTLSPVEAVKSMQLKVWNESTNRLEQF